MKLPWDCEECGNEWEDNSMITYIECPKCQSNYIGHGELILDHKVVYCNECKIEEVVDRNKPNQCPFCESENVEINRTI